MESVVYKIPEGMNTRDEMPRTDFPKREFFEWIILRREFGVLGILAGCCELDALLWQVVLLTG